MYIVGGTQCLSAIPGSECAKRYGATYIRRVDHLSPGRAGDNCELSALKLNIAAAVESKLESHIIQ
jgi:hypothetical protein